MNDILAQELLSKTMGWSADKLKEERKNLQLLSEYKYNEYQQFEPGMRFVESLARWLGQFEKQSRDIAYDFIMKRIIFISEYEMNHFIRMAYPDFIEPYLINQTADEINVKNYRVHKIVNDRSFCVLKRKCLFLGLSDGARIDAFRRFSKIKHEQIHPTYFINEEKANDLLNKLQKDLNTTEDHNDKYQFVFLLDDFTASGKSYLRIDEKDKPDGKIIRFCQEMRNGPLKNICNNNVKICMVLYIATKNAKEHIKKIAEKANINIDKIIIIADLGDSASVAEDSWERFIDLAELKLDNAILTDHYRIGKHKRPYMGFDECGLSVVLSHNCPNNSLPIIWHESEDRSDINALFPRSQRHS